MPSDRIEKLFSKIKALSDDYGSLATEVSDYIDSFEAKLNSLAGKVEASVEGLDGRELLFDRLDKSGNWGLLFRRENGTVIPVHSASVETKLAAIELFEPLLLKMVEVQRAKQESLKKALTRARTVIGTLSKSQQEGQ